MEAIILAGGFGTRLRPFTFTRAKPLLPVLNQPMISHLIQTLPKKVDTVVLAVNYRRDQIEEYFCTHDFGKTSLSTKNPSHSALLGQSNLLNSSLSALSLCSTLTSSAP